MPEFSLLSESLDMVVKDISVESDTPLIHNGRTKNIAALTDVRSNRTWEEFRRFDEHPLDMFVPLL